MLMATGEGLDDASRAQAAGLGLAMEIYQGEQLLAAQRELSISSLVDLSSHGVCICRSKDHHCACMIAHISLSICS